MSNGRASRPTDSWFATARSPQQSARRSRCESRVARLIDNRSSRRRRAGSYVFDADRAHETIIKWEGDTDIVHGIEPLAHLDPAIAASANVMLDYHAIGAWTPMQDVDETNGCVWFLPGSHLGPVLTHRHWGHDPAVHILELAEPLDTQAALPIRMRAGEQVRSS